MADLDKDESLRDLIARLIESVRDYARAEIALVKQTAASWVGAAKPAIAFVVVAILLVQASLTVLVAAAGVGIGHWLGLAGGLAVGAVLGLVAAGLLVYLAIRQFSGMSK